MMLLGSCWLSFAGVRSSRCRARLRLQEISHVPGFHLFHHVVVHDCLHRLFLHRDILEPTTKRDGLPFLESQRTSGLDRNIATFLQERGHLHRRREGRLSSKALVGRNVLRDQFAGIKFVLQERCLWYRRSTGPILQSIISENSCQEVVFTDETATLAATCCVALWRRRLEQRNVGKMKRGKKTAALRLRMLTPSRSRHCRRRRPARLLRIPSFACNA
mmetsp:Transcript_14097/g.38370  ORF Transcript_14097/g.38370 Transcript_14097/m.38370 type:complete len:218 (+) Transcript_14097:543-1196(+)